MQFIKLLTGTKVPDGRNTYYNDISSLSDAAIALDNYPGVVFIDFDDMEENNGREQRIIDGILAEYPSSLVVKTDRGYHLYYRTKRELSCWTKGFLNIGIQTDCKIGKQYGIIKRNGFIRQYQGELSFDNLTELPDILLPIKHGNDIENLSGLKEGDGRHNKLLSHLCRIRKNYDDIDLKGIEKFINNYVFDDQLSDKELENIYDSAINYDIDPIVKENKGKSTLINRCKEISKKLDVHISNEHIYFKKENKYVCDNNQLKKAIYEMYPFKKREFEEILFQLPIIGKEEQKEKSIVSLRNGAIVDGVYDSECHEFSSTYIDIEYDENAYVKDVDEFLNFISNNDLEKRLVIEEMIGHCLMTKDFPQKVFLLVGAGANGKSTLVNVLHNMFNGSVSSVPINRLERDDYIARLNNMLVNISDDVDYNYLKSTQHIKTLASGDFIEARELYGKPFHFKNKATLIFTMNELVGFADHSYGLQRRLCIIPFNNTVLNADPNLLDKLTTDKAKSYLLRLGIAGMNRIKDNAGKLTSSSSVNEAVKNYLIDTDSVYAFLNTINYNIVGRLFGKVYEAYCIFCSSNHFKACKNNIFGKRLRAYGFETKTRNINGFSQKEIIKNGDEETVNKLLFNPSLSSSNLNGIEIPKPVFSYQDDLESIQKILGD